LNCGESGGTATTFVPPIPSDAAAAGAWPAVALDELPLGRSQATVSQSALHATLSTIVDDRIERPQSFTRIPTTVPSPTPTLRNRTYRNPEEIPNSDQPPPPCNWPSLPGLSH